MNDKPIRYESKEEPVSLLNKFFARPTTSPVETPSTTKIIIRTVPPEIYTMPAPDPIIRSEFDSDELKDIHKSVTARINHLKSCFSLPNDADLPTETFDELMRLSALIEKIDSLHVKSISQDLQ